MAAGSWLPFWLSFWGQPVDLSGQATEAETATGTLTIERRLTGQAPEQEAVTGALTRTVNLSAVCASFSTANAALVVLKPLAGQSNQFETAVGALHVIKLLTANISEIEAVSGQPQLTRSLTIIIITEQEHVQAALLVTRYLSGGATEPQAAQGDLTVGVPAVRLSGQIDAVSTLTAQLFLTRNLTGQVFEVEVVSVALLAQPDFLPGAVAVIVILNKSRGGTLALEGASATLTALSGAVSLVEALSKSNGTLVVEDKAGAIAALMAKALGKPVTMVKTGAVVEVEGEALTLIELLAKTNFTTMRVEAKGRAGLDELVGAGATATATIETGS